MARRVYEPYNRRGRGRVVTETEVEMAKTEVEEVAAVKVAAKVEPGHRAPYGSVRANFQRGRERVRSLYWAQAECTLRCKSYEVAWQDGGSVCELLREEKERRSSPHLLPSR